MSFRITKIMAFVAVDENDEEGIIGMKMGNTWMPFIVADEERFKRLLPTAIEICGMQGKKLRIVEFSTRTDVTDKYIKP